MKNKKNYMQFLPDQIEAIVFDFDGVFTDNKVIILEDGREAVFCSRSDGLGISKLKKYGIEILILSSEENRVVQARSEKLGLVCINGILEPKENVLKKWLTEKNINIDNVIFVGNDVNDIGCLRIAGCGVVPSDAHEKAKTSAQIVLSSVGGNGAIRELVEIIIEKKER